jgi:hypothetical protein
VFTLILNFLAEEGIGNTNDNEGDNKDEDEDDNDDDDDNDNDEDKDNNNNNMGQIPAAGCTGAAGHAAHARRSPPRPAVATAAAAAANVDQLAADFACAELDSLSYNFQARYHHVFIPTPPLTSRRETVVEYWLVPSVDQTRFSVEVSTKGTLSIFLMNIPRRFTDLNSCVFFFDQVVDQDASAIAAGFCQMQDKIICLFANLANIRPSGQVDVLPFPCEQNPMLIHLLFQGDKLLSSWLQADGDYNHQYLSIVRVVFQAKGILCHGNNHEGTQVICSPHFQRNLQQAQQHPQVPYYAPQQQQQPHVHFAPQPPPSPPAQQQQQQPPQ